MPAIDAASTELEEAFATLQGEIEARVPLHLPVESADAMGELTTATARLLQSGDGLAATMEHLQDALQSIAATLDAGDIAATLEHRVESLAQQAANAAQEKRDAFEAMVEELRDGATEEVQEWITEAAEALSEQLAEAGEQVGEAAEQALQHLHEALKTAVQKVADELAENVKTRCANALDAVVEAAVDRALNEVAETLITTQMGTTITSAIGPYLPAVIALRRSVGAIQSALDALRGGM